MRKRATFVFAIVCGMVCAGSVLTYTYQVEANAAAQRTEALARYGGDQIEVCVATRSIAAGETVDASNVNTRQWLVDLLPENPVTNLSDVAGMQATSPIVAGEVLSHARFEGLATAIAVPAGLQAVGVELGSAQAVGGALEAGAIVDVYAAGASGTACIANQVLVAAVSEGSSGRIAVTLAIAPEHVEELISTTQTASLYLTLPAKQEGNEKDV